MTERALRINAAIFVALHSRGYIGNGRGRERLRNGKRVSEFVDFDDVGNVAASADEPDDAAGENQREQQAARQPLSASCVCRERDRRNAHPTPDALRRMGCCSSRTSACV